MFKRLFGKKPDRRTPSPEPPDLSRAGLTSLFGVGGVRETTNVVLTRMPTLVDTATRFGGVPGYLEATAWPRCPSCKDPMMFVGQVEMGPAQPLRYPRPAILYIFLCQSDPTAEPSCETWSPASGCAAVFAQEGVATTLRPPTEDFVDRARVAELVADAHARPDPARWELLDQRGHKDHHTTLFGQYACAFRSELSVCGQPIDGITRTQAHYAAMAALSKDRAMFIGGFPDWVQGPSSARCACGKAMESVLQFGAFDEALNLGDAGEAYVLACPDRCAPSSFALEWQSC